MNESESDLSNQQIKMLFGRDQALPKHLLEKQRQTAIQRARTTVGQRDTILFAFIKMWTVLADLLAPLFASFAANKHAMTKPTSINKKRK